MLILVAGTGSWKNDGSVDWYVNGSNFTKMLADKGKPASFLNGVRPFVWSTGLSGVPLITQKHHVEWAAGGEALDYFAFAISSCSPQPLSVIAHSHGMQVALYAAGVCGRRIDRLITVAGPVRDDMQHVAEAARANIGTWLHLHSDKSDRWQWYGELFDGHFGVVREHPLADKNDTVAGVGHSEILRDPAQYHWWEDRRWLDWL